MFEEMCVCVGSTTNCAVCDSHTLFDNPSLSLSLSLLDICGVSVALGSVHVASLPPPAHWLELLSHHTRHGQLQSGLGECCDLAHSAARKTVPYNSVPVTQRLQN